MLHACTDMIVLRIKKHLGFMSHPPEIHRENDAADIPFKSRSDRTFSFIRQTPPAVPAARCVATQHGFLLLSQQTGFECILHSHHLTRQSVNRAIGSYSNRLIAL